MRSKLVILIILSIAFYQCHNQKENENKKETEIKKQKPEKSDRYVMPRILLDIDNDKYKILIEDVTNDHITSITNGYYTEPRLGIKADRLSKKEFIRILMNVDTSLASFKNMNFGDEFFKVTVQQHTEQVQDSLIRIDILKALNIEQRELDSL